MGLGLGLSGETLVGLSFYHRGLDLSSSENIEFGLSIDSLAYSKIYLYVTFIRNGRSVNLYRCYG